MTSREEIDELERRAAKSRRGESRSDLLEDIVDAYGRAAEDDVEARKRLRHLFIRRLDRPVDEDRRARFGRFLAEEVEPSDFARIDVEAPDSAVAMFEMLQRFRYDAKDSAERIQHHVEHLLKTALQRFESSGNLEKMFQLLQVAPSYTLTDPEIVRLRSRAHLYEMRRTARHRRILFAYLAIQLVLVTVAFPILFINAENGRIQQQIEEAVNVDVEPSTVRQTISYRDGLYWSIITAASIGYGDITPQTSVGRLIAGTLGVMGVITIGVLAGLVLSWITPRGLD